MAHAHQGILLFGILVLVVAMLLSMGQENRES